MFSSDASSRDLIEPVRLRYAVQKSDARSSYPKVPLTMSSSNLVMLVRLLIFASPNVISIFSLRGLGPKSLPPFGGMELRTSFSPMYPSLRRSTVSSNSILYSSRTVRTLCSSLSTNICLLSCSANCSPAFSSVSASMVISRLGNLNLSSNAMSLIRTAVTS